MTHRRILIADDEPAIAISLQFLFGNAGFETQIARDGLEALRIAGDFAPHLIVLDLMLPRLNGIEVCRALRADPQHAGIKILMLTARGGKADFADGHAAGANAYQVKPFSTKELLALVQRLLDTEECSDVH